MECDCCQDDFPKKAIKVMPTIETIDSEDVITRIRTCNNCNLVVKTEEKIVSVKVFHHEKRKSIWIPIDVYRTKQLWSKRRELD
jgi:transcriptional regulator NrdR family protein